MPTKRAILSELTADELRTNVEYYNLEVHDRRVKAELVDALAGSRKARLDEILPYLSRDRLKELCRAFGLDDSGKEKVDLAARLIRQATPSESDHPEGPHPATSNEEKPLHVEETGLEETLNDDNKERRDSIPSAPEEEPEGLDSESGSWGDYPLDDLLIRDDRRTVHDVLRRIDQGSYVMNPDFQRDFIWPDEKQSKLIESVIMRIPLPVFYMAEDSEGRMVVVDGLQRLSTFSQFRRDELRLRIPDRDELNGKRFSDLPPKFQNRIEDCNLIFYIIDSKAPERARLDIFERVNGGVPLTRQQMRNCLFMGPATAFLKEESQTEVFLNATGRSLNQKTMRDREFVNRFCAFRLLDLNWYRGDMDDYLANCLSRMNKMSESDLRHLSLEFHRGLANNTALFDRHAFRKSCASCSGGRSVINASFWDVMSTGLARYPEVAVQAHSDRLKEGVRELLETDEFDTAITYGTSDTKRVRSRFQLAEAKLEEILGAHAS